LRILFIFAHLDDEAYGPAGTIKKLSENNDVFIVSLCKGDRPGKEEVMKTRKKCFLESCKILGAESIIQKNSDCTLEYSKTLKEIENIIDYLKPDSVYTHNISDIHRDHRIVSETSLVACRPKLNSTIKEFFMCEIPSSTDWSFSQIEPLFTPNKYVDISNFISYKMQSLSLYETELYEYPDSRSLKSVEVLSMYRGKQVGCNYAEAFKQVFKIE
jgi:LmbE family N-acetylglucosaminyl deacetylase